jgi:acetyltransferase
MTIRNLDHALRPRSVAVIGASAEAGSVGNVLTRNILAGGFAGPVYLVNPHQTKIAGKKCYKDIASLPDAPELAVIATPPATVPALIEALGAKGTRAVVVITAGLSPELKQAALNAAQPYCLRIIGPNCLGIAVPGIGLHANFGLSRPAPGKLAFLSQSGAPLAADRAGSQGCAVGLWHSHGRHPGGDLAGRGRAHRRDAARPDRFCRGQDSVGRHFP